MSNYYTYRSGSYRTDHLRRTNRQYRRMIAFMALVISILLVVLIFNSVSKVSADEYLVETYRTVEIMPGDTLWDLAEANKPAAMSTKEYIKYIRKINRMDDTILISGQYLVMPIYVTPSK